MNDPGDLENVFVQAADGQMVPMSTFVSLEERAIAPELQPRGADRSVEITAGLTPELALGDALAQVEEIGAEVLPKRAASCRWPRRRRLTRRSAACS